MTFYMIQSGHLQDAIETLKRFVVYWFDVVLLVVVCNVDPELQCS